MIEQSFSPVLELTRGDTIESIHCGAIAVVSPRGEMLHSYGDPYTVTFLRSAAKPFQVMPFIEAGGHRHYHLTQEEIALMCASHSGTDEHFRVLSGLQAKTGVAEGDLMCGVHTPYDKATADELIRRGEEPTANRHNCSGKHTGMLAYARMNGEDLPTYLETGHPIQTRILNCLSEMSGATLGYEASVIGEDR
ncbi:MAG: asparaginase, partial [Anaerolineales bacterium]